MVGWVGKLSVDHPRQIRPLRMSMARRSLLGAASAMVVACVLVVAASPAQAQSWDYYYQARPKPKPRPRPAAPTEQISKEPFGQIPNGPVQIIISIDQQKLHLYSGGKEVAETLIATGVPQHPTPVGVFSIIEKDILHHSNIYSGAPMPFMQRITWSGVALHEGVNLGHPASHGCIRMPREFAARLWVLTKLGVRVIIARPELQPSDFADTRLFVHMDETPPVSTGAAPAIDKPIKTAATIDGGKSTDALAPKPDDASPYALNVAKASSGGSTTKMDGIASGIVLRSTIGPDAPTQIAAGEPMVPSTAELQQNSEPNAPETPAAAPGADPAAAPMPASKPSDMAIRQAPISIFVSAKDKKIYVRQDFVPLFSAPITIARPEQRFGTHVFTAIDYLGDHSSFRWNVVSLPAEPPKLSPKTSRPAVVQTRYVKGKRVEEAVAPPPEPAPQTAQEVLARIEIPQDIIERISQLIIPGSSLIVSDHGLGEETGLGTDFIIVAH
jgi:lipoprotein-anchoring transpeptidase ErfK/SrfK